MSLKTAMMFSTTSTELQYWNILRIYQAVSLTSRQDCNSVTPRVHLALQEVIKETWTWQELEKQCWGFRAKCLDRILQLGGRGSPGLSQIYRPFRIFPALGPPLPPFGCLFPLPPLARCSFLCIPLMSFFMRLSTTLKAPLTPAGRLTFLPAAPFLVTT